VQDCDEEAEEDEGTSEEEELTRVQQEIKMLRYKQESIMRRQAITQRAKAHRQHINRERAKLAELQYTIDIICQQEQRQEAPLDHIYYQPNANPHLTTISFTNHHLRRKSAL
jgi:ribosomal protein L2